MFQTLQCTGVMWTIHLHTPNGLTKCLGYAPFSNVVSQIIPGIPLKVLPDGVYITYQSKLREIAMRNKRSGLIG